MKIGDKVLLPNGWFPDGKERPMIEGTITAFKTWHYSSRADGQPDVVLGICEEDRTTFMVSIDSVRVRP